MSQKFYSEVTLETLNNATTDTDRFLVGDSGTIKYRTGSQLLSDLGVSGLYVPYTGATGNVDLGTHTLSSYNLIVNHTSGSGVAVSITKGGSGEALTINKTSGSGNAMSVTGGLTSLVDLTLSSIPNATIDTDRFIVSDGGAIKYRTGAEVLSDIGGQAALTNPITGTGTTNYVSKFTGATTLGDSQIFDNGTNVGIGTANPNSYPYGEKLSVNGNISIGGTKIGFGTTDSFVAYGWYSAAHYGISWAGNNPLTLSGYYGLGFFTNGSEKMRVTPGGEVGIGTTSPGYKLDVAGNGRFSNDLLTTGRFGAGSTNVNSRIFASAFSGELSAALFTTFNSAQSGQEAARFSTSDLLTGAVRIYPRVGALNYNGVTVADSAIIVNMPTKPLLVGVQDGSAVQFTTTDIRIGTNNSEKMRITSAGNVGIGTTSPGSTLTVGTQSSGGSGSGFANDNSIIGRFGAANTAARVVGLTIANTAAATVGNETTLSFINGSNLSAGGLISTILTKISSGDTSMAFSVYSVSMQERMRITSGGNVGIGTTSPASLLHLYSSNDSYTIYTNTLNTNNIVYVGAANGESFVKSFGTYPLLFATNGSERMRLTSTGNLGIGTSSPNFLIHSNGSGANSYMQFTSATTGTTSSDGLIIGTGDAGDAVFLNRENTTMQFYTNNTERMRITSSGNVGIGTTSPNASAILHLSSTTQGFLPPRMKTGQRDGIGSPVTGLMIFNTDDEVIQVYTGDGWRTLAWA